MKRFVFILFCLGLNAEIGSAETLDPAIVKTACPDPHRLTEHMHNMRLDLRLLLGAEAPKKVGDVNVKRERIDIPTPEHVRVVFHSVPFLKDGFLVCSYDEVYGNAAVPLITVYVRVSKALGSVKPAPQELKPAH